MRLIFLHQAKWFANLISNFKHKEFFVNKKEKEDKRKEKMAITRSSITRPMSHDLYCHMTTIIIPLLMRSLGIGLHMESRSLGFFCSSGLVAAFRVLTERVVTVLGGGGKTGLNIASRTDGARRTAGRRRREKKENACRD